ncbi:MAG: SRPBCC family protein [Rhizobacter sp.]
MSSIESTTAPAKAPSRHRLSAFRALGLGLFITAFSSAHAAGGAVTVQEEIYLGTPPAQTWAAIRDFATWQSWHPAFAGTQMLKGNGHAAGSVRLLTAKDGARFTEELVAYDAAAHSYTYRILDSPAPVIDYVSTLEVKENKKGSSVVWSSHFKVKPGTSEADAKNAISGIYRLGLDNLASAMQ